jgi:hypothetical protein
VCLRKLTLKVENPPSKALYLLTSRRQRHDALHLQPRHPLLSLPLNQGGLVLSIPDENRGALLCRNGLVGRSLYSMHRRVMSNLRSIGGVPHSYHLLMRRVRISSALGHVLQEERQGGIR